MQHKILAAVALSALVAGASSVRAQDAAAPAPSSPSAAAPAASMPTPNQVVYLPRLPSAAELTGAASGQGLTVEQISQSATQITVMYRLANGQINTVAYQLLPTAAAAPVVVAAPAPAPQPVTVVTPPAPTVIYQQAPSVIYYETYRPYYYPRYYNPPVSLHFGFGYSEHRGGWGHRHGRRW